MAEAITKTREQLTAEFSDLDDRYGAIVQAHSGEQLLSRSGNGWSAAQCMEHVALANSQYLAAIKSAIVNSREPSAPRGPLTTAGWFSAFFVKSIGPQAKVKIQARKKIRPSTVDARQALQRLQETHHQIRELLSSNSQPNLNRIRFKNPFVPALHFTVATRVLVMAAHAQRHLLQAERACNTQP
jgi:DinB superfamily